jgi:hypothetical protein
MAGRRGNWLWEILRFRSGSCALAGDLRTAIAGWHPGVFADVELVCVRRAIGWGLVWPGREPWDFAGCGVTG